MKKGMSIKLVNFEPRFIISSVHYRNHANSVMVQRLNPNTLQLTATFLPFGGVTPTVCVAQLSVMGLCNALSEMTINSMDVTDTGLVRIHAYRYFVELVFKSERKAIIPYSSLQIAVDFLYRAIQIKPTNDEEAMLFVTTENNRNITVLTAFFGSNQESMRQEHATAAILNGLLKLSNTRMHDMTGCDENIDAIILGSNTISFRFIVPYKHRRLITVPKKDLLIAMLYD